MTSLFDDSIIKIDETKTQSRSEILQENFDDVIRRELTIENQKIKSIPNISEELQRRSFNTKTLIDFEVDNRIKALERAGMTIDYTQFTKIRNDDRYWGIHDSELKLIKELAFKMKEVFTKESERFKSIGCEELEVINKSYIDYPHHLESEHAKLIIREEEGNVIFKYIDPEDKRTEKERAVKDGFGYLGNKERRININNNIRYNIDNGDVGKMYEIIEDKDFNSRNSCWQFNEYQTYLAKMWEIDIKDGMDLHEIEERLVDYVLFTKKVAYEYDNSDELLFQRLYNDLEYISKHPILSFYKNKLEILDSIEELSFKEEIGLEIDKVSKTLERMCNMFNFNIYSEDFKIPEWYEGYINKYYADGKLWGEGSISKSEIRKRK